MFSTLNLHSDSIFANFDNSKQTCLQIVKNTRIRIFGKTEDKMTPATDNQNHACLPPPHLSFAAQNFARNLPDVIQRIYRENVCFRETLQVLLEFKRLLIHIFNNPDLAQIAMLDNYRVHFGEYLSQYKSLRDAFATELLRYPSLRVDNPRLAKCRKEGCKFRGHSVPDERAFNGSDDELDDIEDRYGILKKLCDLFPESADKRKNTSAPPVNATAATTTTITSGSDGSWTKVAPTQLTCDMSIIARQNQHKRKLADSNATFRSYSKRHTTRPPGSLLGTEQQGSSGASMMLLNGGQIHIPGPMVNAIHNSSPSGKVRTYQATSIASPQGNKLLFSSKPSGAAILGATSTPLSGGNKSVATTTAAASSSATMLLLPSSRAAAATPTNEPPQQKPQVQVKKEADEEVLRNDQAPEARNLPTAKQVEAEVISKPTANPVVAVEGLTRIQCKVADCLKTFYKITDANAHYRAHGKLFKCSVCSLLFSARGRVLNHIATHNVSQFESKGETIPENYAKKLLAIQRLQQQQQQQMQKPKRMEDHQSSATGSTVQSQQDGGVSDPAKYGNIHPKRQDSIAPTAMVESSPKSSLARQEAMKPAAANINLDRPDDSKLITISDDENDSPQHEANATDSTLRNDNASEKANVTDPLEAERRKKFDQAGQSSSVPIMQLEANLNPEQSISIQARDEEKKTETIEGDVASSLKEPIDIEASMQDAAKGNGGEEGEVSNPSVAAVMSEAGADEPLPVDKKVPTVASIVEQRSNANCMPPATTETIIINDSTVSEDISSSNNDQTDPSSTFPSDSAASSRSSSSSRTTRSIGTFRSG